MNVSNNTLRYKGMPFYFMSTPLLPHKITPGRTPTVDVDRRHASWNSYPVGTLSLPMFLAFLFLVVGLTATHLLTSEVSLMVAALAVGGNACDWLGSVVLAFRRLGAPAIIAAFLPSYLVYRQWLPVNFQSSVTAFVHETNFIYMYVAAVIVGSISGMDRRLLLRGITKVIVPITAGSIVAIGIGSVAAASLGMHLNIALPMVIVPIMAGGVGEGAIPLSLGYADIFHQSAAEVLTHLLSVVLFANLVAIVCAGLLNAIGRRWPALTGNGTLEVIEHTNLLPQMADKATIEITPQLCFSGMLFSLGLYLTGILLRRWTLLPPPVTMLLLAVLLKVFNLIPDWLNVAATSVGRFFAVFVTYPLLFAVSVALTPWAGMKQSLRPGNLVLITLVVLSLTVTGFFVGKLLHLFPVETALINACHTGAGGTGDVAILTAAERLELMPFAQVATRIGGAVTVTVTLIILRWLMRGH
jgi:malate:Na+ symporter